MVLVFTVDVVMTVMIMFVNLVLSVVVSVLVAKDQPLNTQGGESSSTFS